MTTANLEQLEINLGDYQIRPGTWDDLEPVNRMLNQWSKNHLGFEQFDLNDQKLEWETKGFTPETHTRVAIAPDGQLVAYFEFWDTRSPLVRFNVWGRVHPQHTGRGLGTHLFQWGLERAHQSLPRTVEGARVTLRASLMHGMDDARQLFLDHGMTLARHFWRMVIELDSEPTAPRLPDGIVIRPMRRNEEERRVIQAVRDSFKDHWGYIEGPFEEEYEHWMHFINNNPDYDPDLWLMALDGDQVAGISLNWKFIPGELDLGWVGTLGVLRPWRKQGLGLALLQQSFLDLYHRGQRKVGLGVDASSLTGATRLYEKAGMRSDPRFQMDVYELELRPGVDLSTQSAPE